MIHFKKLRIAFDVSGIQRFPHKSLNTIRNFETYCEAYTFIHTWENSDFLKNYCYSNVEYNLEEPTESFVKRYPNVEYKIELNEYRKIAPYFDELFNKIKDPNWRKNSSHFSMFYSMKQADLLRRNFEQKYMSNWEDSVTNMYKFVVSLDNDDNPVFISKALRKMHIRDRKFILNEINKRELGLDPKFNFICPYCNHASVIGVPFTASFFSVS